MYLSRHGMTVNKGGVITCCVIFIPCPFVSKLIHIQYLWYVLIGCLHVLSKPQTGLLNCYYVEASYYS